MSVRSCDVWGVVFNARKAKHVVALAMRVHLHPLTLNFHPREMSDKRLSFFFFVVFLSVQVLKSHLCSRWHKAMSKRNTATLVLSKMSCCAFSQAFCCSWTWLDTVDMYQFPLSLTVLEAYSACWRKTFAFWEGTHNKECPTTRYKPLHTTEGSFSLRSPLLRDVPAN